MIHIAEVARYQPDCTKGYMATLIIKTGPLAGRKFDGIWDLLDAQQEFQESCVHPTTSVESGSNKRFTWRRLRCTRCQACLEYSQTLKTGN
jgi:hypothetical protein